MSKRQRNVYTNGKREKTPQHKLGNGTKRWSKVQADGRCPRCKKQFKQQRQQRRSKNDLIFNLRNSREFRFIHQFVNTVRNIPNRIYKTALNFEKGTLKIVLVQFTFSRICRTWFFHVAILWPFVNNAKEMNKELECTLTQSLYSLPLPLVVYNMGL